VALPFTIKHATFLERFYFLNTFHGKGLAQVAMQFVISLAKIHQGANLIYFTVWENNRKARRFYEKSGFTIIGSTEYHVGQQTDLDYIYWLAL
jgi:diamine N-acetyltransferase